MTGRQENTNGSTASSKSPQPIDPTQQESPEHILLVGDRLDHLVALLADGEIDWPADLPAEVEHELIIAVRRRRRSQLIKLIARSIARDLFLDQGRARSNVR